MTTTIKPKLELRRKVVRNIANLTAGYIARLAIEYAPDITQSVEVGQDVVRHLMKKLKAERRYSKKKVKWDYTNSGLSYTTELKAERRGR